MRSILTLASLACLLFTSRLPADEGTPSFLGRNIDQWSEEFTSSSGHEKVHAAWGIAQLAGSQGGSPQDAIWFSELVKLLSDRDASVRYWGVTGLAKYAAAVEAKDGGRTAVRSTLHPLLADDAPAVRIATAETVGRFGEANRALPVLLEALEHSQEPVRVQAITALENLGEAAKPAEQALRAATKDDSEYVKRIATRLLLKLELLQERAFRK
jgi:HEAT repeat protein